MSIAATEQDNRWQPPTNRDESVDNSATPPQIPTESHQQITDKSDKNPVNQETQPSGNVPELQEQPSTELTANELKFSSLVAQGYSATQAYRMAYPHKQKITNATVRNYASELMMKHDILSEIAVKRTTLAQIARLSEDRIIETLTEGQQGSRAVTDTMLAMYEHANGKAKQTTEVISRSISVNIDLTQPVLADE